MAIPKKIHWCWLSGDPLPKSLQKCINSWKRIMPDYEIILWDKKRFDIHSVKFVADACALRKWAFAADYIRLYALYTEGGIYLDSDVMVYKRFDEFLHHAAFSGIEHHLSRKDNIDCNAIQAAIIGAEKGNDWIKKCMEYYYQTTFELGEGGRIKVKISPQVLADCAHTYFGFSYHEDFDTLQLLKGNIAIYPQKTFPTAFYGATMQSHAIHVCEASWNDNAQKRLKKESIFKKIDRKLCANSRFFAMLHYKKNQYLNKLHTIFKR
ncbi:MAG: hypothetical protein LBT29_04560 [Flavobacteriaceae bacterium]|jgi:hypothetical protein|nr:hypothetical protein [Flavobacteriaceae bacterium]